MLKNEVSKTSAVDKKLSGIGGWLIVFLIIQIFGVIGKFFSFIQIIMLLSSGWDFSIFILPGKILNGIIPILGFEFIGNIIFLIFKFKFLSLIFREKKEAPRVVITYLILSFIFGIIDYLNAGLLPNFQTYANSKFVGYLLGNALSTVIWTTYFTISKRVKSTFVYE